MASPNDSSGRDLERLHREWMEQSEQAFQRMYGADQQKDLVTFSQREERAVGIGRELAKSLIEDHIASDPAARPSLHAGDAGTPVACGCPRCGKAGKLATKPKDSLPGRTVESLAGEVGLEREQYLCTTCRVVFFPLGPEIGAVDGGIQPDGCAEGCAPGRQGGQFRRGQRGPVGVGADQDQSSLSGGAA